MSEFGSIRGKVCVRPPPALDMNAARTRIHFRTHTRTRSSTLFIPGATAQLQVRVFGTQMSVRHFFIVIFGRVDHPAILRLYPRLLLPFGV